MMKPSDRLLLGFFLCLLWGVTDSDTTSSPAKSLNSATTPTATTIRPPDDVQEVTVSAQNENNITLTWVKVNNIPTYYLKYVDKDGAKEEYIDEENDENNVSYIVTDLTAGREYTFTVITTSDGGNSSGKSVETFTHPRDADDFKSIDQSETSITLQWNKVENIDYVIKYGTEEKDFAVTEDNPVNRTISALTTMTEYTFTLFTVFKNVRSRGINTNAFTAPPNPGNFTSEGQNETSITLQWDKVADILSYKLVYDGKERDITSEGPDPVQYIFSGLKSGTEHEFTLFAVFETVRSRGVTVTAVTAPYNPGNFKSVGQNENSITLQWDKVDNILSYKLVYDGNETTINASEDQDLVKKEITGLVSGTKYDFSVFTLFHDVRSSGHNYTAATIPSKVAFVNVTERSVNTVTLAWEKVRKDWTYILQINDEDLPVDGPEDVLSKQITSLTPGTEYTFRVITKFFGHSSKVFEDFTVTTIDCAGVHWQVTNSSIQGTVEGLFSTATASNESQSHVSQNGSTVSFTGLFPGATYELFLVYENNSRTFEQCKHTLQIIPPDLLAHCEYSAAGYSVLISWNRPDGLWTSVEVNVTEKTYNVAVKKKDITIAGFKPAKTYKVSVSALAGDVRSSTPFVFSCQTDPRGVIAGSIMGVLLFVVLVCMAAFILLKRPDIVRRNKTFTGGTKKTDKKLKAVPVEMFPDHFQQLSVDDNRGFSLEYQSLMPVGTEQTHKEANLLENKPRNRFNNVLPYDWCRVKLTSSEANGTSDYINASYMPGYNSSREYIATQGPLPSTVDDFWRMIWEQRVRGIVMVTNCTESGKTKCEHYWPADKKPRLYGDLGVTIRYEQKELFWTLREFTVKHKNSTQERTVKHFHFTAWPDHGVPQGTEDLIQFRGLVREHIKREATGAPTVVHCSAGVGRTGTIIALDVLLQQLEKERAVGINAFVHKMRLSRPHMVQTESQYVFLHQCIMDSLQQNERTEETIYENSDMMYVNATALREFQKHNNN